MTAFDLVFRGGLLVDGTGAPPRPADVGVLGDRILAVGDLRDPTPASLAWSITTTSRNLLSNGSFEGSLSGWTGWQSTLTAASDGQSREH